MVMNSLTAWNDFFHARTGPQGCRLGGYMRISYAIIFLLDKFLLGLDLDEYFSPTHGIIPLSVGRNHKSATPYTWTLFELFPESDAFLWTVYYVGIAHGILLLAGIAPRLQVLGIMVNLISFHNHNYLMWDAQDGALRVWGFLLLFLPLHHVTIYDWFFKKNKSQDSWPMWPFRLWQFQVVCAYMGASLGKLDGPCWIEGLAMYRITHTNDFYPGLFNPDFLFNRQLPSKLLTWTSLCIELTCFLTVWVPVLRIPTLVVVFFFHVGIDLAMNMHTFEWSSILAWASFLVQPDPTATTTKQPGRLRKRVANIIIVGALFVFFADPLPVDIMHNLTPEEPQNFVTRTLYDVTWTMSEYQELAYNAIRPFLAVTGIAQGYWNMYSGWPDDSNCRLDAVIQYQDGTNETWNSPDWLNMTWYERKRYARIMDYYEYIESSNSRAAWESLCFHLARKYGSNVQSVNLGKYSERSVYPLPDNYKHGWFEVSRQFPMEQSKRKMLWIVTNDDEEFERRRSQRMSKLAPSSPSSNEVCLESNQTSTCELP